MQKSHLRSMIVHSKALHGYEECITRSPTYSDSSIASDDLPPVYKFKRSCVLAPSSRSQRARKCLWQCPFLLPNSHHELAVVSGLVPPVYLLVHSFCVTEPRRRKRLVCFVCIFTDNSSPRSCERRLQSVSPLASGRWIGHLDIRDMELAVRYRRRRVERRRFCDRGRLLGVEQPSKTWTVRVRRFAARCQVRRSSPAQFFCRRIPTSTIARTEPRTCTRASALRPSDRACVLDGQPEVK